MFRFVFNCLEGNCTLKEERNISYLCAKLKKGKNRFHFTGEHKLQHRYRVSLLSVDYSFVSITSCSNANSVWLGSVRKILSCVASVTASDGLFLLSPPPLFVACSLPRQYKDSACLNSGILNAYTTGFTKELEKRKMLPIKVYLQGIEPASMFKMSLIINGSHDSKARRDTNQQCLC